MAFISGRWERSFVFVIDRCSSSSSSSTYFLSRKITPGYLDIGRSCPKIKEVFLDG